ncbi:VCBS repeat-containing protein [Nocardia sp. NPDC051030]|uniref:FG-GAP repeat domain-containing protein n=1 Tax=Nocardia sp. NPDC051030 TaxID=3155162 RepID=UPI003415BF93
MKRTSLSIFALAVAASVIPAFVAPGTASAAEPWFGAPANPAYFGGLANGEGSQTVASGDFDGDGKQDVAVSNFLDAVVIFHGNGDGTLTKTQEVKTGLVATGATAGDLTGDGRPDLVVTNGIGTVSVLVNDGHGQFRKATDLQGAGVPGGIAPVGSVIADFDGDGINDIAIDNLIAAPYGITLVRGHGDGTFDPPRQVLAGIFRSIILVGDLNHDGAVDLVTADAGQPWLLYSLINDGHGNFDTRIDTFTHLTAEDMKLVDVDGDGNLDVVSANAFTFGFSVFRGHGDGTFDLWPTEVLTGFAPTGIEAADFDGDGKVDIGVLDYLPGTVKIYRNNGNLNFSYVEEHQAATGGQALFAVDLHGTGRPDLLAMSSFDAQIAILPNRTR